MTWEFAKSTMSKRSRNPKTKSQTSSPRLKKRSDSSVDLSLEEKDRRNWWNKWEVPRKLYHSSIGFIVIALFLSSTSQHTAFINVFRLLLLSLVVELLRLGVSPSFNTFVLKALGPVMRSHEGHTVSGNSWYLLGASSVLYFFPLDIASMGIVYLAWCDPFASLMGQAFGRFTYRFQNRKTIAGFMGGVAMGMLATYVFYGYIATSRPQETYLWQPIQRHVVKSFWEQTGYIGNVVLPFWVLVAGGGVIAGLSEMFTAKGIDDNFLLPVMSATVLYSIRRICEVL